jgi:hypothetical protein
MRQDQMLFQCAEKCALRKPKLQQVSCVSIRCGDAAPNLMTALSRNVGFMVARFLIGAFSGCKSIDGADSHKQQECALSISWGLR